MQDNILKEIIKITSGAGDFSEIYIENTRTTRIKCEDNKIENIISGFDCGAGIRVIKGEETFYGSTNDVSSKGLLGLAGSLTGKNPGSCGRNEIVPGKLEIDELFPVKKMPDSVPVEKKIGLVRKADEAARAVDRNRVKQVLVVYLDTIKDTIILNSNGTRASERKVYTTFLVNVVAAGGGVMQTGYESAGGLAGFELFDERDVGVLAEEAAKRAIGMLKAKKAPSGEMLVVLSSEAGGTMIHEAIGHSLEADAVQKGISPVYAGKVGVKVASELISVVDDSTLAGKRGSFKYDDEGCPASRTLLVDKGILRNYMYDYITAVKEKAVSTGNGRRESYLHAPIPRMTNTIILPGKDSPEKIVRSVKKGLFVKKMGGGQVDTANGNFVFDVSESYEIRDGGIGGMVRGATLIGNGPEILKSIDMVGSDLGFNIGTCGKEGQGVPVADAQPTLRIPSITVGGTG